MDDCGHWWHGLNPVFIVRLRRYRVDKAILEELFVFTRVSDVDQGLVLRVDIFHIGVV